MQQWIGILIPVIAISSIIAIIFVGFYLKITSLETQLYVVKKRVVENEDLLYEIFYKLNSKKYAK